MNDDPDPQEGGIESPGQECHEQIYKPAEVHIKRQSSGDFRMYTRQAGLIAEKEWMPPALITSHTPSSSKLPTKTRLLHAPR